MENTEIIVALVQIQTQFRMLHWQTTSYSKHQAFGGIYSSLDGTIDEFVEACMRWVPKWAAGCPINCESGMGPNYGECK